MYVSWKIERTPRNADTLSWSTDDTYEITEYYDPIVNTSIGTGRDTFEFKINNINGNFNNTFQPNDKINVYRKVNSTSMVSTDLLINGTIQNIPINETYNQNMLRVNGYNYTEALMNAIIFLDAEKLTISEALQQSLLHLQAYLQKDEYNKTIAPEWHTSNPSTKVGGGAFPIVGEKFYNKPLINLFEKYSQKENTTDGYNYYFYVDKDNKLVWLPELDTPTNTFNTITDLYRTLKVDKDIKDVKNFVIVKGGRDPAGQPMQERYMDWSSIAKNGMRFYYLTDIATKSAVEAQGDMKSIGVTTGSLPSIALGSSYAFTTTWISKYTGDYVVVHNDAEYIKAVREHITAWMLSDGNAFLANNAGGKLKVSLTFQAGKGWNIGNVISCTIPALVSITKNLRVQSAQYTSTEDIYDLVEDIGSI
jgi:hypothetical protein